MGPDQRARIEREIRRGYFSLSEIARQEGISKSELKRVRTPWRCDGCGKAWIADCCPVCKHEKQLADRRTAQTDRDARRDPRKK